WAGFWLNTVTGIVLFLIDGTTKSVDPDFYIKLIFIAAAVILMRRLDSKVFGDPLVEKRPIQMNGKVIAFASIVCWVGAITAGRLLAYVGPGVMGTIDRKQSGKELVYEIGNISAHSSSAESFSDDRFSDWPRAVSVRLLHEERLLETYQSRNLPDHCAD